MLKPLRWLALAGTILCAPAHADKFVSQLPSASLPLPGTAQVPISIDGTNLIQTTAQAIAASLNIKVTAGFTVPAINSNVTLTVDNTAWMAAGATEYIATAGLYSVVSVNSSTSVTVKNLGASGNATAGTAIAANVVIVPGGLGATGSGTVTSVTCGTGLTGGTITTSGTCAVSYGTTSSTAAAGNDSRFSSSVVGIRLGNGAGSNDVAATAGVDYAPATSGSAILKGNGLGGFSSAAAGTDYLAPSGSGAALTGITAGQISGLAASATTDTTNATNITSGTLGAARLPTPTASTLGGVESLASTAHQFLTSISTLGVPVAAQPAATDISGLAASATTDTTNASNISSGTLGSSYGGAGTVSGIMKANGSGTVSAAVAGTDYPGLGTVDTYTKAQIVTPTANATATGTVTPDFSASNNFRYTLTGNLTVANGTNPADGEVIRFYLKQDATGGHTLTMGSAYKFSSGTAPVASTAASAVDFMECYYDASDTAYACNFIKGLQ